MTRLALVLAVLGAMGCGEFKTSGEIYSELWNKCQAKHLAYEVNCNDSYECSAYAWDSGLELGEVLDGRHDYYQSVGEGPTEAANKLSKLLNGYPNQIGRVSHTTFETGEVRPGSGAK